MLPVLRKNGEKRLFRCKSSLQDECRDKCLLLRDREKCCLEEPSTFPIGGKKF